MIGSGILLLLTLLITVGWLYVEMTDALGTADRGQTARDGDTDADL
ncbi:hypothetical protein [Halorientalis regularis]|jgi:hypothetical protein|uniref:Uncharacterized protein n=1 Tax=Halorientalis regularis TaxID=660518 RepID=A0A1G7NUU2_9EURY|nr:hypothetical protein [Halorientalis regularis]SDF77806.1 hypothetical protein SAMN05216218_109153 [Halorientalis regularis]